MPFPRSHGLVLAVISKIATASMCLVFPTLKVACDGEGGTTQVLHSTVKIKQLLHIKCAVFISHQDGKFFC